MRNITALLIALLLATACSSAPGAGSALSGQLPPPITTTTPTNPQLTYADMSPKCAEALEAASLLNPVPAIYSEVPPEYGPGSVDWLGSAAFDLILLDALAWWHQLPHLASNYLRSPKRPHFKAFAEELGLKIITPSSKP